MIGVKSLAVLALAATTIAVSATTGVLSAERLAHLPAGSAFAIGLFASVAAALVGFGASPKIKSRAALAVRGGRPRLLIDLAGPARAAVRELPATVQRILLVAMFACVALGTFTAEATARIASAPADLLEPSRAEYCRPESEAEPEVVEPVAPPPPPVDQAGCALVKRAFALGYAKSLGSCAPKVVTVVSPRIQREREVCLLRQPDEPFVHYAWRRVVETAADASPIDAASTRAGEFRTRVDFLRDLLADVKHSITGTPHASHHLWINLPDPRPSSWINHAFSGEVPCQNLFADLPLWPVHGSPSELVEHVFGQLLFATRFGTPASCSDYTIHWDAEPTTCARLAADPAAVLDEEGALTVMHGVLDRRKRQLALRALADALGHPQTLPEPPPARAVVSASCIVIDSAAVTGVTGREVTVDGEPIALRELKLSAIRTTGAGPIAVYVQLARLLGGAPYAGPADAGKDRTAPEAPGPFTEDSFLLTRLEPLVDADPFVGAAGQQALERADLVEVFPFEQHLHAFIDAFRRVYLPQRGRL